jgi:hypothetical protein
MSYDSLCKLGSGFHVVELDESDGRSAGVRPSMSEDESDIECVRFGLFMRRTSSETQSGFRAMVVMCFNERTAKRIMSLLDEATRV